MSWYATLIDAAVASLSASLATTAGIVAAVSATVAGRWWWSARS